MIFHRVLPLYPAQAGWRRWAMILLASMLLSPFLHTETLENETAFSDFDEWWQNYVATPPGNREALIKNGLFLAKTRRAAMLSLIENDPAEALRRAFAEEYHSALPKPIGELVEVHLRGLAKLTVTEKKDGTKTRRVTLAGETWKAYLYGPRLELPSREEIPIHGIGLDGLLAVDGSPLERFPNRESLLDVLRQSEGKKTCPISGEPGTIPTAVGDILLWFSSEENLITCEKALIEKEMNPDAAD